MVDKTKKRKKFSTELKKIKLNRYGLAVDEQYEDFTVLIGDAVIDNDIPEWKRKLASAVYEELYKDK